MWASAGFLVAAGWGVYFAAADKALPIDPNLYTLASVTQPIVWLFHRPLGLSAVTVANAATYALAGLIVEAVRKQLHHRS
jgi:hypothetical protein